MVGAGAHSAPGLLPWMLSLSGGGNGATLLGSDTKLLGKASDSPQIASGRVHPVVLLEHYSSVRSYFWGGVIMALYFKMLLFFVFFLVDLILKVV